MHAVYFQLCNSSQVRQSRKSLDYLAAVYGMGSRLRALVSRARRKLRLGTCMLMYVQRVYRSECARWVHIGTCMFDSHGLGALEIINIIITSI